MKTSRAWLGAVWVAAALAGHDALAFELPKIGVPDMFGGGSGDRPPAPGATQDCPGVFIDNGAAMVRVPADADSANVRYQISITSTARECVVEGDRVAIRIGVEGGVVLGPVGAPGSYGANVNVTVRRIKDESIVSSKNYRVNADIPSGGARADFRLLAEPVSVPAVSARAQDDYEILVGFTQGATESSDKPTGKNKKGRRRHGA